MTTWGLMPPVVRSRLQQLEWDNSRNLRGRLLGDRPFPIPFSLRPPTGRQALEAMPHFQDYMAAWRNWSGPGIVEFETRSLPQVGRHDLPKTFTLRNFEELAEFLGQHAVSRSRHWAAVLNQLCEADGTLRPHLIRNLPSLESLSVDEARLIAAVLRQLRPGLGRNRYRRALPLTGVDTKFVEQHLGLLTVLADALHSGEVSDAGSLEAWLECRATPRDWLLVRPLCPRTSRALGGIDLLQVPTATLLTNALPGSHVLIVENTAAGYALPALEETVAVFGGGANIKWTQAPWLSQRRLGYWGDIDTWGLHYLAEVRGQQSHVEALLMDQAIVVENAVRMIDDKEPNPVVPPGLTPSESELYHDLLMRRYGGSCLEQERISADRIYEALNRWRSMDDAAVGRCDSRQTQSSSPS